MNLILSLAISSASIIVAAYILPGVQLDSPITAIIVAIVLGALNLVIKPLLSILTLPITVLTFGLFAFVVNALIILLADFLIKGLVVDGFLWALALSLVISVVSAFLNSLLKS